MRTFVTVVTAHITSAVKLEHKMEVPDVVSLDVILCGWLGSKHLLTN